MSDQTKTRQPVYDALDKFNEVMWVLFLSLIRPVNRFVGNCVLEDPTPCVALDAAIEAQLPKAFPEEA